MKPAKINNGYRMLYMPDHPSAYSSQSYEGYIYEHRMVMEESIGRPILKSEVVHHLDGNKLNNRKDNLILLADQGSHARLHAWIDSGTFIHESYVPQEGLNTNHRVDVGTCAVCEKTLQEKQTDYCSNECRALNTRRVERPSKEALERLIDENSWLKIGRMYGVSDNAVRKWARVTG